MKQTVPCRECWRCQKRRVDDYVGRMLAEDVVSDWSAVLTLTYAPVEKRLRPPKDLAGEHAEKVLNPEDFQKFIRSLRRRGHSLRYFVAGEYGEEKGRAHFHAILFGQGPRPVWHLDEKRAYKRERLAFKDMPQHLVKGRQAAVHWPQGENFHLPDVGRSKSPWPHGHVFCDWSGGHRAFRYACKYLLKNEPGRSWFSLSKKPPLGTGYFEKLAERNIGLQVLPSSFEYAVPGGKEGQKYLMQGAARRDYLLAMIDGWTERHPLDLERLNEWVRDRVEKVLLERRVHQCQDYEMQEYIDDLRERLDRSRPTAAQVASALRSSQMFQYLFDPMEE